MGADRRALDPGCSVWSRAPGARTWTLALRVGSAEEGGARRGRLGPPCPAPNGRRLGAAGAALLGARRVLAHGGFSLP